MVSLTFPTTLSLLSLAAPPQRVSQVTASVGAAFPCTTIPLRRVKTEFWWIPAVSTTHPRHCS